MVTICWRQLAIKRVFLPQFLFKHNSTMSNTEEVKKLVDAKIAGKKVMVFSKRSCPFCVKAKKVLGSLSLTAEEYEVMEIDGDPKCGEMQDYLQSITGARSVPRVFINGKCIGGGNETEELNRSGKLREMLK